MKFVTQAKSTTLRSSTVFGALLGINKNRNLTTVVLFAYLHIHTYIRTLYHFIILLIIIFKLILLITFTTIDHSIACTALRTLKQHR